MSGHSHYSTIKRQKETRDAAKGKIFSKLARAISIAVKTGSSADPDSNPRLRVAIEQARAVNMPKENVERAISKATKEGESLEEVNYEGFGPGGVGVIVETATDNKNRTAQEIKNIFERAGGSMGGPGSVSFNFESLGLVVLPKDADSEQQMLKLIDFGAEDLEETEDAIEIYTSPDKLSELKKDLDTAGFNVSSVELVKRPKNVVTINDPSMAQRLMKFLDTLEEHEDVQKVFANLDIPQDIINRE